MKLSGTSLFFTVLALAMQTLSCTTVHEQIKEGVAGRITLLRGNQMPGPGRSPAKGRGVVRQICFYAPTAINDTKGQSPLFDVIRTNIIATTKSDSAGNYVVKLPPGNYSVFIVETGKYFASETNGDGILNEVKVVPKQVTKKDLVVNYSAVY